MSFRQILTRENSIFWSHQKKKKIPPKQKSANTSACHTFFEKQEQKILSDSRKRKSNSVILPLQHLNRLTLSCNSLTPEFIQMAVPTPYLTLISKLPWLTSHPKWLYGFLLMSTIQRLWDTFSHRWFRRLTRSIFWHLQHNPLWLKTIFSLFLVYLSDIREQTRFKYALGPIR